MITYSKLIFYFAIGLIYLGIAFQAHALPYPGEETKGIPLDTEDGKCHQKRVSFFGDGFGIDAFNEFFEEEDIELLAKTTYEDNGKTIGFLEGAFYYCRPSKNRIWVSPLTLDHQFKLDSFPHVYNGNYVYEITGYVINKKIRRLEIPGIPLVAIRDNRRNLFYIYHNNFYFRNGLSKSGLMAYDYRKGEFVKLFTNETHDLYIRQRNIEEGKEELRPSDVILGVKDEGISFKYYEIRRWKKHYIFQMTQIAYSSDEQDGSCGYPRKNDIGLTALQSLSLGSYGMITSAYISKAQNNDGSYQKIVLNYSLRRCALQQKYSGFVDFRNLRGNATVHIHPDEYGFKLREVIHSDGFNWRTAYGSNIMEYPIYK